MSDEPSLKPVVWVGSSRKDLFGVRQPDISNMLRGEFRQFSVERLLRFLVKLNQDVEIVVKPQRGKHDTAALHVF
jgi:Helix-turn-helix domain